VLGSKFFGNSKNALTFVVSARFCDILLGVDLVSFLQLLNVQFVGGLTLTEHRFVRLVLTVSLLAGNESIDVD